MVNQGRSGLSAFTAHTWTLSIEIMLFAIWVILFKTIPRVKIRIMFLGAILAAVLWRSVTILCGADAYFVSMCPLAHIDAFAMGGLVAFCERSNYQMKEKSKRYLALGLCGMLLILIYISKLFSCSIHMAYVLLKDSENYMSNVFTGNIYLFLEIAAAAILMASLKNKKGKNKLIKKQISYLGGITYEIYLFHWPVIVALKKISSNPWINFMSCFALTLIITIVYRKIREVYLQKRIAIKGVHYDSII